VAKYLAQFFNFEEKFAREIAIVFLLGNTINREILTKQSTENVDCLHYFLFVFQLKMGMVT